MSIPILLLCLFVPIGIAYKSMRQAENMLKGRMHRLHLPEDEAADLLWRDPMTRLAHLSFIGFTEAAVLALYFERPLSAPVLIAILVFCGLAAFASIVWGSVALGAVYRKAESQQRPRRRRHK